jgi:hypothetical protein
MDEKSTRRAICGIQVPDDFDLVPRVVDMHSQLLVEFSNCGLFRRLSRFHLSSRKRELAPVDATLGTFDQEHLAVEWVHVASTRCRRRSARACDRWGNEHCRDRSLTIFRD